MTYKEKLFCLLDRLDENDQRSAYEFIKSLASMNADSLDDDDELLVKGARFHVVPD